MERSLTARVRKWGELVDHGIDRWNTIGHGPLPLPWPEFNARAKKYFRRRVQRKREERLMREGRT